MTMFWIVLHAVLYAICFEKKKYSLPRE